jgi:hypothetical protein
MSRLLFLFPSSHAVIKAERLCQESGLSCRTIAVPRQISTECGIAMEIAEDSERAAADLLTNNNISFQCRRLGERA